MHFLNTLLDYITPTGAGCGFLAAVAIGTHIVSMVIDQEPFFDDDEDGFGLPKLALSLAVMPIVLMAVMLVSSMLLPY